MLLSLRTGLLALGLVLLLLSALFPPMRTGDSPSPRAFLFSQNIYKRDYEEVDLKVDSPRYAAAKEVYYLRSHIDLERMLAQWMLVAMSTTLLYHLTGLTKTRRKS